VNAVIPNWNKAELLGVVLEDLRRQTFPVERVVVVDNGSTDASAAIAERAGATVLRLSRNRGFAYAVNRGIERCDSKWVLVLNNDVTFGPDWLKPLVETAARAGAWFAVGKLRATRDPQVLDGTFDAISRGATAWRCGNGRPDGPAWSEAREVAFPPLTAALVRRELFETVGLLDESFESYLEDVDLGLRCAARGFTGIYAPSVVAYHAGSATLGTWHKATVRRIARNQVLLVRKHFRGAPRWPILVGQLLWGLVALRHGAGVAWFAGIREGLRMKTAAQGCTDWFKIRNAVERSEMDIRSLQKATGFDLYWRCYFALVRS
jgi:GT2 family glycosyltransferase